MLQCKVITATSTGLLETAVNAWLTSEGDTITVDHITTTEGTTGVTGLKVYIFYTHDWTRVPH